MLTFKRLLCGAILSAVIVWTIYLLTVDFYSLAIASHHYKQSIYIPFPVKLLNLYSLAIVHTITIIALGSLIYIANNKPSILSWDSYTNEDEWQV